MFTMFVLSCRLSVYSLFFCQISEQKEKKPSYAKASEGEGGIHHELEEDLLLSKLNSKKEIKDESLESQEEHFVLNILLLDLADFPKDNSRWMVKFKVFEEILDHHLSEEEDDLFPEAEKILTKEDQTALGSQFIDLKERRLLYALETKPVKELGKPKRVK